MSTDPGHKLGRIKRFGNIIVRSKAQAADHIHAFRPGRNHKNGNVNLTAYLSADLIAAAAWQHNIKEYQVIMVPL